MKDDLIKVLKNYIKIFIEEYQDYLTKDQLLAIKNIDYNKIIRFDNINTPIGDICFNQIILNNKMGDIFKSFNNNNLKSNKRNTIIQNGDYSSYINYIKENSYNEFSFYVDHLMYMVFKLVIGDSNGLINGFINNEVNTLSNKYHFCACNLYKKEEIIAKGVINTIGIENIKKIMFMDLPSAYEYLNNHLGNRYAEFYYKVIILVDREFDKINNNNYIGNESLLKYAYDYDHLLYGEVYNYLIEFGLKEHLLK